MTRYQLAQVNIARAKASLDDPLMAGFVARLDEINKLADQSTGFVWRLQTPEGANTYLRPYDDDRILFNMSIWESIDQLKNYVYFSTHIEVFRNRQEWFERFDSVQLALWWIPAGYRPSVDEAKKRLLHLETHGPTQFAFTFKRRFEPDEGFIQSMDWTSFEPCPAT